MRFFLILLLVIAIPFNAAYAATTAIFNVVQHTAHPDHHPHGHVVQHDSVDSAGNVGQEGNTAPTHHASDHHHSHVNPVFISILSASIGLNLPIAKSALTFPSTETFNSAHPSRLERPPRTVPVA